MDHKHIYFKILYRSTCLLVFYFTIFKDLREREISPLHHSPPPSPSLHAPTKESYIFLIKLRHTRNNQIPSSPSPYFRPITERSECVGKGETFTSLADRWRHLRFALLFLFLFFSHSFSLSINPVGWQQSFTFDIELD